MAQLTKVTDTITPLQAHLASIGACSDACTWAGTKSARETWETCERADWLLWFFGTIQTSNGNRLANGAKQMKLGVSTTIRFSAASSW